MKGDISLPFIALMVGLVITLGVLIPTRFMSVPTTRIIKYEQDNNNAQLTLITLLSSTYQGKTIQQLIGEYLVLGQPNKDLLQSILKQKLDQIVESECYVLSTPEEILSESECNPKDYMKEVWISLPYNKEKLTEKLTLVIN